MMKKKPSKAISPVPDSQESEEDSRSRSPLFPARNGEEDFGTIPSLTWKHKKVFNYRDKVSPYLSVFLILT